MILASMSPIKTELSAVDAFQFVWIATGISLLSLTVLSAVIVDQSVSGLMVSDDSYIASLVVSFPVAVCFSIGAVSGWWFQSGRVSRLTTSVTLLLLTAGLWISDLIHNFGEGHGMMGLIAVGIFLAGTLGLIVGEIRDRRALAVLSVVPHLLFGFGYLTTFIVKAG